MRKYGLGAFQGDRDGPSRVLGRLHEPLLSPNETEREVTKIRHTVKQMTECAPVKAIRHGRFYREPFRYVVDAKRLPRSSTCCPSAWPDICKDNIQLLILIRQFTSVLLAGR